MLRLYESCVNDIDVNLVIIKIWINNNSNNNNKHNSFYNHYKILF